MAAWRYDGGGNVLLQTGLALGTDKTGSEPGSGIKYGASYGCV